jgi:5-methylcytosine-specific restriction endonuclease McrA
MGTWVHRLSEVDAETRSAICSECGPVSLRAIGYSKKGNKMWRCKKARVIEKKNRERPWSLFRGEVCERCGFVPEHISQLDVDHKDGNKSNNDPSNLQTLCANCHRLKTYQNRDWENKVLLVNPLETP